jgi:hypothetical protein
MHLFWSSHEEIRDCVRLSTGGGHGRSKSSMGAHAKMLTHAHARTRLLQIKFHFFPSPATTRSYHRCPLLPPPLPVHAPPSPSHLSLSLQIYARAQ